MQRVDQRRIELQQRLAPGAHHQRLAARALRPFRGDRRGQFPGGTVLAAAGAIGADEIRVAELAYRAGAVLFPAAPQVAAGKAAEHRGAAGVGAFALQRIEDFLDGVSHAWGVSLGPFGDR
ncbi:hypothetical protein D3C72_1655060 [compost metagenome]